MVQVRYLWPLFPLLQPDVFPVCSHRHLQPHAVLPLRRLAHATGYAHTTRRFSIELSTCAIVAFNLCLSSVCMPWTTPADALHGHHRDDEHGVVALALGRAHARDTDDVASCPTLLARGLAFSTPISSAHPLSRLILYPLLQVLLSRALPRRVLSRSSAPHQPFSRVGDERCPGTVGRGKCGRRRKLADDWVGAGRGRVRSVVARARPRASRTVFLHGRCVRRLYGRGAGRAEHHHRARPPHPRARVRRRGRRSRAPAPAPEGSERAEDRAQQAAQAPPRDHRDDDGPAPARRARGARGDGGAPA
ncbi:hypothetical protein OF83DRAFT_1143868 [Amylostereum chailletii]|nr:hypothetical protein OF83DRAFT_1143868 [Amylostereum chailletii]